MSPEPIVVGVSAGRRGPGTPAAIRRVRKSRALGDVVAIVMFVLALAACGESAGKPSAVQPERVRVLEVAGAMPSASSRMICAAEGKQDIARTLGVDITRALVPRWRYHIYSCNYVYRDGQSMTLSVKELSSLKETTAYFDELGATLGRMHALQGLGQGAYQTKNGSTVVRKDFRVLLVDISALPATFGTPASPRADVSLSVAATIMGCWTEA